MNPVIDALQYANWSEKVFRQMRAGGIDAVHATITCHENFRETVLNLETWNRWFERFPDLIFQGFSADDIARARASGRTAVFFGAQNPSCIEDDIGLVEVLHRLGLRFMQLSYNNQSLLASGCYEAEDTGLTRMGREVVAEMNRVGMVVDMSHSGERSTLEAIAHSTRPVAITHANPASWHPARRNKSDRVLRALAESGGMLGFSVYPHHLRGASACTLAEFCAMVARTAELMGVERIGIGTDLCQDQPDSVVDWMRAGRWTKRRDYGEGSAENPGFPPMPGWFRDNRDMPRIVAGLWRSDHPRQAARLAELRSGLDRVIAHVAQGWAAEEAPQPWDALWRWGAAHLPLEAQEALLAAMLEPHGALIDGLGGCMDAESATPRASVWRRSSTEQASVQPGPAQP